MKRETQWQTVLEDENTLMQVILTDEPIPEFSGDPDSQAGRLYQTLSVIRLLTNGAFEEAYGYIRRISGRESFWCHQLAVIWLQAELEDAGHAYEHLTDWIRSSEQALDEKRSYHIRVRQSVDIDRRLAFRWAPVLRLYLATLIDQWDSDILEQIEADRERARENGIHDVILKRLDTMIRMTGARHKRSTEDVFAIASEWYALCLDHPEYGHGGEFILEAAIALEASDRQAEALIWIDRALHLMPDRYDLLLTKARLLKEMGDWSRSLAACDQLIRINPDDFSGFCLRSNTWFLQGNFRKALKDAETACRLAPSNPNSLVARAFVYMQTGQYQQALQDFRLAVEQDPDAYDARRGEGKCLSMLGRDQEALTCFNQLRRLYPDEPELYYEMADVLFSAGYLDDCENACRRCVQLDSTFVNAYVILAMIAMRRQEDDLARGLLERAVSLEPDNPFALNELAYLMHLSGEDEQALETVSLALAESPDYADAWCNKGLILYYTSEFEKAGAAFDEAVHLAPDHVTAWVGRGNTFSQLCVFDDALHCYDQALLLDPRSADACHGKALLYRIMGLEEDVIKWQERALQLDPEIEEI